MGRENRRADNKNSLRIIIFCTDMKLSIVTINRNNAEGLRKTIESVLSQTYREIEYIIIDGASTDNSVDVIRASVLQAEGLDVKWLSEPDKGIYNAMNKGIEIALGKRVVDAFNRSERSEDKNKVLPDYIQILNSGDILASADVTERMVAEIEKSEYPELLYGNMIRKDYSTGKFDGKSKEVDYSLRQYYASTMNHDCCYIHRDIYEKYGLYDENLKIVSDWKWFLQAIGLGNVKPVYADIDVTIFDCSGISETNLELRNKERRQVLKELMPPAILADYDAHAFDAEQMNRLRKYHLYGLVYFIERVLFKLEKWRILK